jgi:hypothetical protein
MKESPLSGIDPEHARRMVYGSVGAAIVAAGITLWAALSGNLGLNRWNFVDAGILLLLAFGVYRRSYACAVALLVYHVGNRVLFWFRGHPPGSLAVTLAVVYALGIMGIVVLQEAPPPVARRSEAPSVRGVGE